VLTERRVESLERRVGARLDDAFKRSDELGEGERMDGWDAFKGDKWRNMAPAKSGVDDLYSPVSTGIPIDVLAQCGFDSIALPTGDDFGGEFRVHSRIQKAHVKARQSSISQALSSPTTKCLDWSTAEAMAFGSLTLQGFNVRLCGQDSKRGTFSHRHAYLTDQETGRSVCPLSAMEGAKGTFEVVNSVPSPVETPLSTSLSRSSPNYHTGFYNLSSPDP